MHTGKVQRPSAPSDITIRPDWLASRTEEIIEPELPIIDAHHHFWDVPGWRYLFDDFLADTQTGHNVVTTVFVQCFSMYRAHGPEATKPVGETEFVVGMAAQSESGLYGPTRFCTVIVGSVDFSLGDAVEGVLRAHIAAGGGRFKGIRARTAFHENREVHKLSTPSGVLMETSTRKAIACIARMGLTLDISAFPTQVEEVLDVCRTFPEMRVVVNHTGRPLRIGPYKGKGEEAFALWSASIRTLSASPNVYVKLGGLASSSAGFDFHLLERPPSSDTLAQTWAPYFDTCIQTFGPERCLFASNFPIDKGMCSYPVLWNTYKRIVQGYSSTEKQQMLFGTAKKAYNII